MDKKKILLSHYSIFSKDRWGRIFPLARSLAKQNITVTLITSACKGQKGLLYTIDYIDNVKIISFKDIIPFKILNKGIGFLSFVSKILFSLSHKFDYVYSDCGELPNAGWPCKINQWIYKSVYISEWGDLTGRNGFYDRKPGWFKFFFGNYYLWAEFFFRRRADIVMVLSDYMKQYAESRGISSENIVVVPGGAPVDMLPYIPYKKNRGLYNEDVMILGYIGIGDSEILDLIPLIRVIKEPKYRDKFKIVASGHRISSDIIKQYELEGILKEYGWIDFYSDFQKWECVDVFLLMKKDIEKNWVAWPNKLGDYLSIGRPVMLNFFGSVTKFANDYPYGLIQVTFDRDTIAQQLDNILSKKYDLIDMGIKNRMIAEKVISWDSRAEDFVAYLEKITANP